MNEAFELCIELEALLSITANGGDIWRINHASGEAVTVDYRTIEVLRAGLEFGVISNGMLDITIGKVSRLWNFGSYNEPTLPSAGEIDAAIKTVDHKQVIILNDTVQLLNPDAAIDLGAIAKGYIADKIAGLLIERGVSGALIDLGGDVRTVGNRLDGNPWRIALRKPFGGTNEWIGVVDASNIAVVSSGTYERQFELDGDIYHHILDPTTGMPVKTDIVSATVISENALNGEGLSTILILAGSDIAPEYFKQIPGFIGAVVVLEDGEILEFGSIDFNRIEGTR